MTSQRGVSRRPLLGALAALAAPATRASAQAYPSRPVRIIIGYPPGGSNDVTARIIQPKLQELLGQPVIIENRPGANATLGADYVVRSDPDGYTLFLASSSPLVIAPFTSAHVPYDTGRDFAAIATVAQTPSVLAVGPATQARNLPEFLALARRQPVNIASSGAGGLAHLAIEILRREVSQNITHVPYRGGGPAATDTISGNVHGVIVDLAGIQGLIRDGKLRPLAVMSDERSALMPDVPTFTESGVPGVVAVNWVAVLAPKRTPQPLLDRLHDVITQVAGSAETRERFAMVGLEPKTLPSTAAAQAFINSELARWSEVARVTGVKADD
ncbi:tripartite-type tricarboxylate transporter receptor subunit TctC [Humitalea rosea]|uniref:Tripartite-type tricarboxylate transporter receptor subunit TctC n=1 Tax=Humitalea rosea TaxID=990373 RepID=A0A2W7KQN5_9PROT|nr:tripartite tricarboxylate transporter substrate binding protein [Humitalea rosea]PZW50900.1 tripartite-type tricarboxylate transporter receptor subunit TctC [Humitalea rosea]